MNEKLKEAREKQIKNQKESHAFEIQREKDEFNKIIKLYVNDVEKTNVIDKQQKLVQFFFQLNTVVKKPQ